MILPLKKLPHFLWRGTRNLLCLFPATRQALFPRERLAAQFGPGDADYAWRVFQAHAGRLMGAGFVSADRILEIGPGRSLGTALLWCAALTPKSARAVELTCWDVFKNASPERPGFWPDLARSLLQAEPAAATGIAGIGDMRDWLERVAAGSVQPQISYRVEPLPELERFMTGHSIGFDLLYSQAAIEHIWDMPAFWATAARLTGEGGWHSHRIDLADHGRRESNYVEMLEWSPWAYAATMCFVPGAINRWRAQQHIDRLKLMGFEIHMQDRETRAALPVPRERLAEPFRSMSDPELRTTAVEIVARRAA